MNIYDFQVPMPDGSVKSLSDYKGNVLLIVNTASYCGYTSQLKGLERDYHTYKDQGYRILALPVNQFQNQEPDSIDAIVENYRNNYGVTFDIGDKALANGPDAAKLFVYLKEQLPFDPKSNTPEKMIHLYQEMNQQWKENSDLKWNFTKFLIDRTGTPVKRFEPEETPSTLVPYIEKLLTQK